MKSQTTSRKAEKQPHVLSVNQHARAAPLVKPARQLRSSSEELHKRIAMRAYELYAQRGWREDHALDDWLDAEREILGLHVL